MLYFGLKTCTSIQEMEPEVKYSEVATVKEATKVLGVNGDTLRRWAASGKIKAIKTPGGHNRYNLYDYFHPTSIPNGGKAIEPAPGRKIIYARVSSRGQKDDLQRQVEHLLSKYPNYEVFKDIGSGLNFKRKYFKTLVDLILKGQVSEIVVTNRDRLCRFGFELVNFILSKCCPQARIVVLNDKKFTPEEELCNDIISIITVFSARLYGLRSHKHTLEPLIRDKDPALQVETNQDSKGATEEDVIYL